MQSIRVSRYEHPKACGWAGYIEPEDGSWIAFIGLDGKPRVFLHRDAESGAILPDDAEERAKHIDALRAERERPRCGGHIGERSDGSADYGPDGRDPLKVGERIFPLGESGGGGDVEPLK